MMLPVARRHTIRRRQPSILLWSLALGLAVALGLPAAPTRANGNPINVTLAYLPGVSNWGPTNAAGVAELVYREGEVRLTATGLPPLEGEQYRLWLVNTGTGERQPLVRFNASESGVVRLDQVLAEAIPEKDWNLLLVTVEPEGAGLAAPGERHAIAGRIQPPAGAQGRPAELPRTGGPAPDSAGSGPGGAPSGTAALLFGALGLVLTVAAAFGLGRWSAGRHPK